jgi:hypothetical protein
VPLGLASTSPHLSRLPEHVDRRSPIGTDDG